MNLSPASESELAPIESALAEFRELWRGFMNMPPWGDFTGTIEDVRALDYLDYENLGYPPSGLDGAALVWGNVLAKQLGMKWVMSPRGDLLLRHGEPGFRVTVWPFARVLEMQKRSSPQYGGYQWLLDLTIRDSLDFCDLSGDAVAWCREVLGKEPERVVLTASTPGGLLEAGDVGTIVHAYDGGREYEIEFSALDGVSVITTKVKAEDVRPIGPREMPHSRRLPPA